MLMELIHLLLGKKKSIKESFKELSYMHNGKRKYHICFHTGCGFSLPPQVMVNFIKSRLKN